ncbi:MAG: primosomal protein N' [Elusimicrobia bacterium]|nr:primosomal protein N' [Elusimicrobiota bacterium]
MFAQVALPLPLERTFSYQIPAHLSGKVFPGMRVSVPFGPKKVTGYVINLTEECNFKGIKEIYSLPDPYPVITENLLKLAFWMSFTYVCSLGEALDCIFSTSFKPASKYITDPNQPEETIINKYVPETPSGAKIQSKIVSAIKENRHSAFAISSLNQPERISFYIDTIAQTLQFGDCLLLVPEIILVEEVKAKLQEKFGAIAGAWHSCLSERQKHDTWFGASSGKLKIIVGTRSALFMPFKNPKLIIVDDETDQSYKNPQKPLYDAIRTAAEYAKINSGSVILGSELVSINTYHNINTKKCTLLSDKKTSQENLPEIKVVSISKGDQSITNEMNNELQSRRLKNELSLIFMNRRGYSTMVFCRSCKTIMRCAKCGIPLSYHTKTPQSEQLKCHYCSLKYEFKDKCLICKSVWIKFVGIGSERVESTLKILLPQANIIRADQDTIKSNDDLLKILNEIKSGKVDILIGTHIILPILQKIKSLSARKLSFVGLYNIDHLIYQQDYRASEKAFQVLYKLAGLLDKTGMFMMQTADKKNYMFAWLAKLNWKGFYKNELELREDLGYPPFKELINVIIRGKEKTKVEEEAQRLYNFLEDKVQDQVTLLGPEEPPHPLLRGEHRRHILLKLDTEYLNMLNENIKYFKPKTGIHIAYDLNPYYII